MGLGARLQTHKDKIKKETSNDTFRFIQNPGIPESHRPVTAHFNLINKCGQKVSNQSGVNDEKQTESAKNPCKKILGNSNSYK